MSPLKEIPEDTKALHTIESNKINLKRHKILAKIPERQKNQAHNTSIGFNVKSSYGQESVDSNAETAIKTYTKR